MADTKISDLTDGVTAQGTDAVPAARSGANVKLTVTELGALANWNANKIQGDAVVTASPDVGEALIFNGTQWVNSNISNTSATQGPILFLDDSAVVDGYGAIAASPGAGGTVTDTIVVPGAGTVVFGEGYIYNTAIGSTTIPGGVWEFDFYCDTSAVAGTSQLLYDMYKVVAGAGTVTITGSGTSRTCTASSSMFVAGDANANPRLASYVQTAGGTFQITAFTSGTVVTIATSGGYVNESAAAYTAHRLLFNVDSPDINSTVTILLNTLSVQPAFTVNAIDKLALRVSAQASAARTINWYHNGTTTYSHMHTPLAGLHNDQAGLQGGNSTERYHLSLAQFNSVDTLVSGTFSTIDVQGSFGAKIKTITNADSPYTAGNEYTILCDCTAGAITVNLPTAAGVTNRIYNIKKIDATVNAVTIDAAGTEPIDGALTQTIAIQYTSLSHQCDGSNWWII